MPRGGRRGGARAPPRNAPRLRPNRGVDRLGHSPGPGTSSIGLTEFTLQDEARSTAHRSSPWSSDSKLRHRPVAFVSTGSTEPLKQLEDILQNEPADKPIDDTSQCDPKLPDIEAASALFGEPAPTSNATQLQNTVSEDKTESLTATPADEDAMNAAICERPINPTCAETQPTEEAPAPLPFFLDVIGDKHADRNKPPIRIQTRSPSPAASDSSEEVILFKGRNKAARDKEKPFNLRGIRTEIKIVEETVSSSKDDHVAFSASDSSSLTAQSWKDARDQKRQEEDELIADYIANMREHGDDDGLLPAQAYSLRDLGGSLSESESIEESFQTVTGQGEPKPTSPGGSELDGATAETEGLYEGSDPERLGSKKHPKNKTPRVDEALLAVLETDASYLGSIEQSHAEDVSPQSETSDQDDDEDDIFTAAADRFANEVDDFDYMDWDRPALKRKKGKGARGKVPIFDISDSELEGKMQAAWKNDRLKKAERKRERQATRAQGLLGKHANPEDLRVKYPDGMGLEHIAEELRTFLLGSQATLTFPPMDNHGRKIIHELASKFFIKSKSTGSGDQRRPMLHRTFRTAKFAEEAFDMAIARVGRKYFPRNDTALRAAVQRQSARRGGGGGHAGVHYRDGEVVGGSAPELGQENKGRAMLEKMGWSSGTALGALNNKGILQPVAHIVKRSKAGLG